MRVNPTVGPVRGGTEAIDFAAAHPEMVSALVIVAGSPGWQPYSDALIRRTSAILVAGKAKGPAVLVEGALSALPRGARGSFVP